ncbi:MFS transporter [Streptomyces sp. B93]|uniref:MFS transporter n=1 Tax=Streptomyces sp. B93 TaxID=2824875 RepID=UPI001B388A89|nr:MFS transporter [Streptomyces sp. B93]MBQ1089054.1 MFS transporter [Streptomyces sp. B93]
MTISPARAPGTGRSGDVRRLTRPLYCYAFLDELVLLYPVYALLFADSGMSGWQIASLFALWSLTSVVLEVPSGAWADAVSRRLLLWVGPLITAAGYALWILTPSYLAFAAGFVLWGIKGALGSGALEALVYEELDRVGASGRYARVMGRVHSLGMLGVVAAMGLAGPVFAAGGYDAVGAASVAGCLLTALAAWRLPEHGRDTAAEDEKGGWAAALKDGVTEVRGSRAVLGALLLVPVVTGVWGALDEYTPLLVRETGAPDLAVPWLLLVIYGGATLGGLLAGRAARLGAVRLGVLLAASSVALAAGAATGSPAGVALVGLAFGGFQLATVLADARLQHAIGGPARATVTSLAGVVTEVVTIAVFASYAALTMGASHGTAFVVLSVPYAVAGVALMVTRAGGRRA